MWLKFKKKKSFVLFDTLVRVPQSHKGMCDLEHSSCGSNLVFLNESLYCNLTSAHMRFYIHHSRPPLCCATIKMGPHQSGSPTKISCHDWAAGQKHIGFALNGHKTYQM